MLTAELHRNGSKLFRELEFQARGDVDREGPPIEFSDSRGRGALRGGNMAFFLRSCPKHPMSYFLWAYTTEARSFGTAAQWKNLILGAVDRAEEDGWCDNASAIDGTRERPTGK
jgi:hypothetical protein